MKFLNHYGIHIQQWLIQTGGIILLGIDEVDNELIITGVENVDKVIKDFWSTLNGEKVNKNILKNEDLEVIDIDNKDVNGLVDFALSADGQRVVADEGFVPAK